MAKRFKLEVNNNPDVFCPDVKKCPQPTTGGFFKYFCSCKGHKNCVYYNRRRELLKTPIEWLQHMAIQGFKPTAEVEQTVLRDML